MEIQGKETQKNNNYTNLTGNLFNYEGNAIDVIFEDDKPWFKGIDVAHILQYTNTKVAISYNVDSKDRKKYEYFQRSKILPLKGNQKSTIYISKEGLFNLVLESKAKGAKKFKKFVSTLLEKIDNGEEIYEKQEENDSNFTIIKQNNYEDYALTHNMVDLKDKNIFYIGICGKITDIKDNCDTNVKNDEIIFKYGVSADEFRREKVHKRNIDTYVCFLHKRMCFT